MNDKSCQSLVCAFALLAIALGPSPALASPQQSDDQAQARVFLDKGVQAYKNAQFDEAIADFKQAEQLDPSLTSAPLYLATAYASQYIPGAASKENIEFARLAVAEYKGVLDKDPANLSAIDGIAGVLYNMGTTPFDLEKMEESKSYHQRHIEIRPNDPEPYYWIGVIDWAITNKTEGAIREDLAKLNPNSHGPADPLPEVARQDFQSKCGETVEEGIAQVKKAISLKSDYDDAMAFLNFLYRQKAKMESQPEAREADIKIADDLIDQIRELKDKRMREIRPQ